MYDEEIGELDPTKRVLNAANENDSRKESDLITEKEPTKVNKHNSTLFKGLCEQ